jgi:DNA-binding GntR family transcriptional regulator
MTASQPEHAAIFEALTRREPGVAAEFMRRHILLLTADIVDFLQFVRGTPHDGLFAPA